MPQARRKKAADTAAAKKTGTSRRAKAKAAEAEADEDEDDEDEDDEPASTRRRITEDIAQRAADMREEGATWVEVQEELGFNGAQLRPHIARLTNAKVEGLTDDPESVAEARNAGVAWYSIATSLGITVAEAKELAAEGGADVEGRIYTSNGGADDEDEDMEDEDEQEEAPKPKRSRSKSGTATKTADKPKTAGKRRRSRPSSED
jgi:hypothetical protein